jgi:hypothetical protein
MSPHVAALEHYHSSGVRHAALVGRAHFEHHKEAGASSGDPVVIAMTAATSTSFHVVAQFSNSAFFAAVAVADNDVWAVGYSNATGTQQPLAVHFNGTSWSAVPTPSLPKGGSFSDVAAVASNDVWAVGSRNVGSSINTLIEHWDGTSWSIISSPALRDGASLSAVTAVSSNNVWAAGDINVAMEGILVEHWDGTSWSVVSSPAFAGVGPMYDISADASNDVWTVGGATRLHFDGTNWSQIADSNRVNAGTVLPLTSTSVWASGIGPGATRNSFPRATFEHWNGTSWSIIPSPNPHPCCSSGAGDMAAVSASDIFALATGVIEHWDGTSWSIVDTLSGVGATGVTALSDGTVVVLGENGGILQN